MVFGYLNASIREKVSRHKVTTYEQLLKDAREVELSIIERESAKKPQEQVPRCTYCSKKGHLHENCFKKQKAENIETNAAKVAAAIVAKPKFACYGCNAPGVTRANCTVCNKNKSTSSGTIGFNAINPVNIGRDMPLVNVQLFGVPGQAFFDTGARTSVASANLKKVLDFMGCKYQNVTCDISLADGVVSRKNCLATVCKIVIGGRCLNIQFIVLPDANNNRTLIGADFLEQVNIVLNMGQRYWYFEDNPTQHFDFVEKAPFNLIEVVKVANVTPKRKLQARHTNTQSYKSEFENYGPDIPTNDYSPKSIQAIFKDALPANPFTPQRQEDPALFPNLICKLSDENDDDFMRLYSIDFKLLKPKDGANINVEQKKQLDDILHANAEAFSNIAEPTPYAEHKINTGDHEPIFSPPYRLSFAKTKQLKEEVEKMIESGIIEEGESPWASPVVMVPKKTGGIRICIDYRKLNAVTVPDRYPLPRMDDILHAAKSTQFMSTLDLQSGYYQIKMNDKDAYKTCFITPFGTYLFRRMPFGLRNAPATFQRLMDRFKALVPKVQLLIYLDYLIVCSSSYDEHLNDLNLVLSKLQQFKLRVNNNKSKFCCERVKYLGHVITIDGICVDEEKTAAIRQRKEPRNVKELISFVQTCSWYRRFISGYAELSKPLTELTKKNVKWCWTERQKYAFESLKQALTSAPILKQAQDNMPFCIKADASAYAIGAALLQGEENKEHPIEYASRLLSADERNYSTTEREALAIVWACSKFRGYIEGSEIILVTDHQPLKWLLTIKSPSGRLARWALQIQQYNFKVQYSPGKTNSLADMLSRPLNDDAQNQAEQNYICAFQVDFPHKSSKEIRDEQLKDEYIEKIISSIESQDDNLTFWSNRGYVLFDGILFCYANEDREDAQMVVPQQEREDLIKKYHDESTAGHYGVERSIHRIANRYFWPGMRTDIAKHVKACIECQRYKATNLKPMGLFQTTSSNQRFEVVAVDLFGPLPKTNDGFQWILVVEDVASRWTELFALKEATAEICAKTLIDEIFLRYGIPRRLKSDNGVQFISAIMQKVAYCMGIEQQFTPVYHPQANPVERKNRDIKTQLAILVGNEHNTWNLNLPSIRFALNTAKCQSTGFTSAYLTFGRELRTLDDVQHDVRTIVESENFIPQITPYLQRISVELQHAKETQHHMQDKNKTYFDQRRRSQDDFDIGTEVLATTHTLSQAAKNLTSKFVPKRDGPYTIIRKVGSSSYEIASKQNLNLPLGTYHVSSLSKYNNSNQEESPAPMRPLRRRGRPKKN